MKRTRKKNLTGQCFDAMAPAAKEKIFEDIERATASGRIRSVAPTIAEQARLNRVAKKLGRPKIGRGTRIVSVTVEAELLERADAFAASAGLNRSELFTRGLQSVLPT